MSELPKKYNYQAVEEKWRARWDEMDFARWDPEATREETFVVDTPPPTVSGSLHVGHVFSYTQQDFLVRYQRMLGKNIAYPMGWDDNGLPTERRVQNYFGIRCNPKLPYVEGWKPTAVGDRKDVQVEEVSRKNFIEACAVLTEEDEKAFEELWRNLGLSLDWSQTYATIDDHCRRVSQVSFLDLIEKGLAYSCTSPTMWDVDFKSAIAQAEVEDREKPGAYHDVRFGVEGGGEFTVSTTRPELIGACIAVVAHPDDERYQPLFGKNAITPLYHARVPILAAEHAEPDKGTGILMVCTFGDIMDVEWWKQSELPIKQVIGLDGKILAAEIGGAPFESENVEAAKRFHAELVGLKVNQARKKIAELLAQDGTAVDGSGSALVGQPKQITHPVKYYEKGDRPLEFVPTRQWYTELLKHKDELLEQGRKIKWHPSFMLTRYEHWVLGLNQDWCVSRQRFFGVPFPVWYPVQDNGEPDYDNPIFAAADTLPIDPLSDVPPGYSAEQRDVPGGFSGDPDVMDTWATSSLSPQIMSGWGSDPERHKRLFPMDIRPQAHEIIRTWAFYTIVKAWMHENAVPWYHAVISGWILDPDRKKMSKSKGNVVTPQHLLDEYSSDAVRYWAGRARLGTDTVFDTSVFKVGRRLTTKLFNATKFVIMQLDRVSATGEPNVADITVTLDIALVGNLRNVIQAASEAFDEFEYAAALQVAEDSFWAFCDDYLELVKVRSYAEQDNAERRSAIATLGWAIRTYLRLFAPFLPYVTDECWSWRFATEGRGASVHTAPWPAISEVSVVPATVDAAVFDAASEVLSKIRGAKTAAQKSLKTPVTGLIVVSSKERLDLLQQVLDDVLNGGNVDRAAVELTVGEPESKEHFGVDVQLA